MEPLITAKELMEKGAHSKCIGLFTMVDFEGDPYPFQILKFWTDAEPTDIKYACWCEEYDLGSGAYKTIGEAVACCECKFNNVWS